MPNNNEWWEDAWESYLTLNENWRKDFQERWNNLNPEDQKEFESAPSKALIRSLIAEATTRERARIVALLTKDIEEVIEELADRPYCPFHDGDGEDVCNCK